MATVIIIDGRIKQIKVFMILQVLSPVVRSHEPIYLLQPHAITHCILKKFTPYSHMSATAFCVILTTFTGGAVIIHGQLRVRSSDVMSIGEAFHILGNILVERTSCNATGG